MYKGINAVTNFGSKMFKGIGSGVGKLFKAASGGKGVGGLVKNAIKYSPLGLAATGAKKLFGWMTGDDKKKKADEAVAIRDWKPAAKIAEPEELLKRFFDKRKKIEEIEKNNQFSKNVGAGMVKFTPIVSLLKEIISIMKGEDTEKDNDGLTTKPFEIDKEKTTVDKKNANNNALVFGGHTLASMKNIAGITVQYGHCV